MYVLLVAVPGNTYTYIIGIDREDVLLLCDPDDGGYLVLVRWFTDNSSYYNPLNIFSELNEFPSEPTLFSCGRYRFEIEIFSSYVSAKGTSSN